MPEIPAEPINTDRATDIAIVGDGLTALAGAAILSLAEPAWRISVITAGNDASPQSNFDATHSARTIALSAGSLEILSRLFAKPGGGSFYEHIIASSAPITSIQVSDRGHGGLSRLNAESECSPLGRVIENAQLLSHLKTFVSQRHNIRFIQGLPLRSVQARRKGFQLVLERCKVNTHLLLVADGSSSPTRNLLGIRQEVHDYRQTAVVATLRLAEAHRGNAYERFTGEGPVALLPMTDGADGQHRASLVWTQSGDQAEIFKAQVEEIGDPASPAAAQMLERLQRAFGNRAGNITGIDNAISLPLGRKLAEELVRSHLVLLGGAACSLHPVAGQGFNLILRDITTLAEVLQQGARKNHPLGQLSDLQTYARRRAKDQQRTVWFSDQLPRLFTSKSPCVILGRNLGLTALNLNPGLRQTFARSAAGQTGRRVQFGDRLTITSPELER